MNYSTKQKTIYKLNLADNEKHILQHLHKISLSGIQLRRRLGDKQNQKVFCGGREMSHTKDQRLIRQELSEKKIRSVRKEIWEAIQSGVSVQDARKSANKKYGYGWRERGLISNSDDQWSTEELNEITEASK